MTDQRRQVKDWLSTSEIADLLLPDLPGTRQGVTDYAARNGWNADPARCRNRVGRGGGLEYHVSLLPTLARMQYEQRTMTVGAVVPIRPQPQLPAPATNRARRAQAARLAILAAWERYGSGLNLRETGRAMAFVDIAIDGLKAAFDAASKEF